MAEQPGGQIEVCVCGRTHRGRVRKENQDNFLVVDLGTGGPDGSAHDSSVGPFRFPLSGAGAIVMVADGMGGRAGGARASALAVSSVRDAMKREAAGDEDFGGRLARALEVANEQIHTEAQLDDALRGMGTTATLAGIRAGTVYLAQVGDSRAYLIRGDHVGRVTRDQSLIQEMVDAGVLSEAEARNARDNRILQALGTSPSVTPVLTHQALRRQDVLMLCSDGLFRVVADEEILEIVRDASDCLAACDQLIALANARGGPDNITVVLSYLAGDGLGPADGADRVALRSYEPPGA